MTNIVKFGILMLQLLVAHQNSYCYYPYSSHVYCMGNPVNFVDPDGLSTWVVESGDGIYEVVGGDLNDNDRNIYVGVLDENGEFIKQQSIGITTSITSFYKSDENGGHWAKESKIDTHDMSGDNFLYKIFSENPPMFSDYMKNARTGGQYDFKVTNGTSKEIEGIDIYRGMPIGTTGNGQPIFSSARDIGNIAAGYVAASNGMSWNLSRMAFDTYQGGIEGISTRNAEYYGWRLGCNNTTTAQQTNNLLNSIYEGARWLFHKIF